MAENFDLQSLCAFYDRGYLVPFIGSGMSRPACSDWATFVGLLEGSKPAGEPAGGASTLIQRALFALQTRRQEGADIAKAISEAVYCKDAKVPDQAVALASIYWPLICTTNYDDIYLRAKLRLLREKGWELKLPRVLGRSETDCRELLRHIDFPAGEAVWALQGLLGPQDAGVKKILGDKFDKAQFEQELVVGHAEYRTVANRAPHFRRCFAELFRTRSFLFLGSGLSEPYFVSLFDEIIELTGHRCGRISLSSRKARPIPNSCGSAITSFATPIRRISMGAWRSCCSNSPPSCGASGRGLRCGAFVRRRRRRSLGTT